MSDWTFSEECIKDYCEACPLDEQCDCLCHWQDLKDVVPSRRELYTYAAAYVLAWVLIILCAAVLLAVIL